MERKKINVYLYTFMARRVFLFPSPLLFKILRPFTLVRKEYNDYNKTIVNVIEAIEELPFKEKITLVSRPFTLFFLFAFYRGGYRSPVIVVGKELFSYGTIPNKEKLKEKITYLYDKEQFLKD